VPGLRVAVDVTPLLGRRGGVTQCVRYLLDALPRVAADVEVVPYVLSRRARDHADELPAGTRALALPAGIAIRVWGLLDVPTAGRPLSGVQVVHGTNFVVPPVRVPATVTVHDTWCLRHPSECAAAVRPFDRAVRRAVRRGAWVHVSTAAIADEVRARYETDRVAVVPFGVPEVAAGGALPPGVTSPFVLAISSDEPRKRHAHLVRAFAAVAEQVPDVQLVLAGADAGATPDVEREIAALAPAVRARVVRLGAVADDARAALLRGARVLAYPSSDEGFGFPVLEAMSVGVPVVSTRAGGIPEASGDAALLVEVTDDVAPLVGALCDALTDDDLRARLVARGTERAAARSWDDHARGMVALWHRLAEAA
jgi:glycosyltransferase involved in cell wall biosynthesis